MKKLKAVAIGKKVVGRNNVNHTEINNQTTLITYSYLPRIFRLIIFKVSFI